MKRHYNTMKTILFFATLICLSVLMCHPVDAQSTNKITGDINFVNVPVDKVLAVYKHLTKSELVIASDVRWATHGITLHFHGSPEEVPPLIEQALLKQAGIAITRLEDKRVSVTYNDNLKLQP
ncbi:MAG: hypothetical protein ACREDQ_08175 [Limisphaerales bacterium]